MRSDFVRTARAKGLTERIGAVPPRPAQLAVSAALSMTGLQVGPDVRRGGGDRDGLRLAGHRPLHQQSIPAADFPAIAGVTLVLGVGYVVINTVVDILQAVADPRVAFS